MIFFGYRSRNSKPELLPNVVCTYCDKGPIYAYTEFRYFHVYWIPFIPLGGKVLSSCGHCQQVLTGKDLPIVYQAKKAKFPLYLFSGVAVVLAFIALGISQDKTKPNNLVKEKQNVSESRKASSAETTSLSQEKQYEDSIKNYQEILAKDPSNIEAEYALAYALHALGRLEDAIVHYEKTLALAPQHRYAKENLLKSLVYFGIELASSENFDRAKNQFEKALKYSPDSADAHFGLGLTHEKMGQTEKAIAEYETARKIMPEHLSASINVANLYNVSQRSEKAIQILEESLQYYPNHPDVLNNAGQFYLDLGDSKKAIPLLEKAIQQNPQHAFAFIGLGNAHNKLGEIQKAIEYWKNAKALNAKDSHVYYKLGVANYALKDYQAAIAEFKGAIEIDPSDSQALYNLACSYALAKQKSEAIEALTKSIALNPEYREKAPNDADFASIRDSKDFQLLTKKLISGT